MNELRFHQQSGSITPSLVQRFTLWAPRFMRAHGEDSWHFEVFLMSDEDLLSINQELLDHDFYTDIITIPVYVPSINCSGELYISVERVADNANEYGNGDFEEELVRVVAHGILHLLGFGDKSDKESAEMRLQEEKALELFRNS